MFDIFAYIDPGTGAIALQVLMAVILGAGIFLRRLLAAPLRLFRKQNAASVMPAQVIKDEMRRAA